MTRHATSPARSSSSWSPSTSKARFRPTRWPRSTSTWSTATPCLRYLRQMRATGAALRMVPAEQVTETLSDQTVDTLLDAFRRRR